MPPRPLPAPPQLRASRFGFSGWPRSDVLSELGLSVIGWLCSWSQDVPDAIKTHRLRSVTFVHLVLVLAIHCRGIT